MSVKFSAAAMQRALVGSGGPIQFVTKADSQAALVAFRSAAKAVEERLAAGAAEGEDYAGTSSFAPAPGGPIAYMNICDRADLLAEWLSAVAHGLEGDGFAGRLMVPKTVAGPTLNAPAANIGVLLNLEYDRLSAQPFLYGNPPRGWWVDDHTTRRALSRLVQWCLDTEGDVYARVDTGLRLEPGAVKDFVLAAVHTSTQVSVQRVSPDGGRHRYLVCHEDGGVLCGVRDERSTWAEQFQLLEHLLRDLAPDATYASVRLGLPAGRLSHLWERPPAAPYAEVSGSMPLRPAWLAHLLLDYVPDAYSQQVMTTRQLERITAAGGLPADRWIVEDLNGGRHLVTARDLEPWLDLDPAPYTDADSYTSRTPVPEPATLARARGDFAPALLTYQRHLDNPTPEPDGR